MTRNEIKNALRTPPAGMNPHALTHAALLAIMEKQDAAVATTTDAK